MKLGESVVLTVTAKGRDMEFNWVKHGDHPNDDITINLDDDQNYETEWVLRNCYVQTYSIMIALSYHFVRIVSTIWVWDFFLYFIICRHLYQFF